MNATTTYYNVWELGPWSRIKDVRGNKPDADYISQRLTREDRCTHVVTINGSAYDKQLRKESRYQ